MAKLKNKMKKDLQQVIFKKSTLAMCVMAASASVQTFAQDDAPAVAEEVIVYGIKQSLETAQDIKREATTVKDVITASDIGALPDKSVVEALQRVPGVAIERFEASDDPDHFSVEGGNVTVRGLNRVRAEINGRDSFSAGADGGLNFSDIPPEMVAAVEVVKSQSASLIEGGISGNINLITRKPFDNDGLVFSVTGEASYADLIDETKPAFSFLASNTWDTDTGKYGALISLSSSVFTSRGDGVGVYNYRRVGETNNFAPLAGSARQQFNHRDRLGIAGALQWENNEGTVKATIDFIRSDSELTWTERFIEFPGQPFSNDADPMNLNLNDPTYNCLENEDINREPCMFTSGTIIGTDGFSGNPFYVVGTRNREDRRVIDDVSLNLEFNPSENWTIIADVQSVKATNEIYDFTVHGRLSSTDTFLDLRHPDNARFEVLEKEGSAGVQDPSSYFLRSAMDHASDNEGDELAVKLDSEYTFDEGLITAVKTGVRVSERTVNFRESVYSWGSLGETWMGDPPTFDTLKTSGLVEEFTFDRHLNGNSLRVNDTFYFPSTESLRDSRQFYADALATGARMGGGSWVPLELRNEAIDGGPFRPAEFATTEEDRTAVYVQIDFGNEDADIPFSGNIGVRYVDWQLTSTGANIFGPTLTGDGVFSGETNDFLQSFNFTQYHRDREFDWQPQSTAEFYTARYFDTFRTEALDGINNGDIMADPAFATPELQAESIANSRINTLLDEKFAEKQAVLDDTLDYLDKGDGPVEELKGDKFKRFLPSFNLKVGLSEDFVARIAFSESIFMPNLNQVRNNRIVTPDVLVTRFRDLDTNEELDRIETVEVTGYVANGAGNPLLQPELSSNYDLTLEWYYDDFGSLTGSFFYKRIRDFFRQSSTVEDLTNEAGRTESVVVTNTQNAGNAKVQGYELAFLGSLGSFDESLDPFGVQATYTFIDGSAEDNGNPAFGGDPQDKYAEQFTFNNIQNLPLEGLSEHNYNFVAFFDNGTFEARFAYNWRSRYLLNSRDVIAFAPVFGESTGQFDATISWQINENFKAGIKANNLFDEVTKTTILNEIDPDTASFNQETVRSPRSYFVNDRRLAFFIQAKIQVIIKALSAGVH